MILAQVKSQISKAGIVSIVLLLVALVVAFAFLLRYLIKRNRCIEFIEKYSVSFKNAIAISNHYRFIKIKKPVIGFGTSDHRYYEPLKPIDYLRYELIHHYDKYKEEVNLFNKQQKLYKEYHDLFLDSIKPGSFNKQPRNKKDMDMLRDLDSKMCMQYLKKVDDSYGITSIVRFYSDKYGDIKEYRRDYFDIKEIVPILKEISSVKNGWYPEDLWGSIERIERAKVTISVRRKIFNRDGNRCLCCGSTERLEIDHIKPIKKGGITEESNLQTLCHDCNQEKGDQTIDYRK